MDKRVLNKTGWWMKLSAFIFPLSVLISCDQQEIVPQDETKGAAIVIESVQQTHLTTRAATTPLTSGSIGVFVSGGIKNYSNVEWSCADSKWTSTQTMYYDGKNSNQQIGAYAPYSDAVTDGSKLAIILPADQSEALATDYLYAAYSAMSSNEVSFTLNHLLAKVAVKVSWGTEYAENPVKTIQLLGMYNKATWTVPGSALDFGTSSTADITPMKTDNAYEALVLPYNYTHDVTLAITTTDHRYFEAAVQPTAEIPLFESGCGYTVKVKVGKDKVAVESVTVDDSNNPWSGWTDGEEVLNE